MRPQELNSVTSVTEDADASAIEGSDASAIEGSEGGQERGMLEKTARELAEQHSLARLVPGGRHDARRRDAKRVFMKRLQQQELLLERAYDVFLSASREELGLSYAAEWYLDNYYLLQRAQHLVQEDFPAHYYDELPKLANDGPLAGFPRIYDIARRLVVIERCEVDEERIRRFLDEYQQIQPLRIGELWALPIMLRVVLLEAIVQSAMSQSAARRSPGRVEEAATPPALRVAIDLRDEDVVASCVPTLHALAHQDWKDFFESVSLVEQTLAEDPAQIYSLMDFDTRDRYRKAVEKLAAGSNSEEIAVAQQAVALAEQHGYATDSHAPDGVPAPGLLTPAIQDI